MMKQSNNGFTIIIPARMASSRLANKMLLDVGNNIPLIIRTAQQALKSNARQVIVATDHLDIKNICDKYGINVIMTNVQHRNGTDRVAEAATLLNLPSDEIVINVQGDEPCIDYQLINQLATFIEYKNVETATIAHPILTKEDVFNPNVVKVVLDKLDNALYFSRAPIPYARDEWINGEWRLPQAMHILRHIGIYAYKVIFLYTYTQLPQCPIELVECIEQVRILYNGYKIGVLTTPTSHVVGVDTHDDLLRIREYLQNNYTA